MDNKDIYNFLKKAKTQTQKELLYIDAACILSKFFNTGKITKKEFDRLKKGYKALKPKIILPECIARLGEAAEADKKALQ